MDFEDEIDLLESVLSDLESAIRNVQDSPYHSYMASSWEMDKMEIEDRLEKLYAKQDEQWTRERKQQDFEYEEMKL